MLNKTYCATCIGVEAVVITVEVDLSPGVGLHLVGLPDSAVRESLLRVVTAITSYGFKIPGRRLVVNLAPADIRKEGSSYDLAIALGLLAVSGQLEMPKCSSYIVMGELALDGRIRPVAGALPVAVKAKECGFKGCILPADSAGEAADIDGIEIFGVSTLAEAIEILSGVEACEHLRVKRFPKPQPGIRSGNDFKDVKGQKVAKRGLEIAAAGSHNMILIGAAGSGKTMMASCLPSILPPMTREESVETSKIYSIAGRGSGLRGLMTERPFRTPHHSASLVSIIGGGNNAAPGEISLAHNGVLYLDEVVQFNRSTLDALRQPVEDGKVTISRVRYKVEYPCSFMLIASMNPCPCGYYGDGTGRCTCSCSAIESYRRRISGPMMDRLDLHILTRAVSSEDLVKDTLEEPSEAIAARVAAAREIQLQRFRGEKIFTNSQMDAAQLRRFCRVGESQKNFLKEVIRKLNLSARAYSRILKLARTIADLAGRDEITLSDLSEAVQYRCLDRPSI